MKTMKKEQKPMVSFIIPVYNREEAVVYCVKSVCNLNYKNIEIIVVDDGSTDNTLYECKKLASKDCRIRIITQQNAGVSKARNNGMAAAKGEYITFIDSDDIILPDYLDDISDESLADIDTFRFGRSGGKIRKGKLVYWKNKYKNARVIKGTKNIFYYLYSENNPYKNTVYNCISYLFSSSIIRSYNLHFDESVDLGEDQIFVMDYLAKSDSLFYNLNRLYLCVDSNISINHLSLKWRSCEQHLHNIFENYRSLDDAYKHSGVEAVHLYAIDYLLDRPISKIFVQYCLKGAALNNKELVDFINKQIRPIYLNRQNDVEKISDSNVRFVAKMLITQGTMAALEHTNILINRKLRSQRSFVGKLKTVVYKIKFVLTHKRSIVNL